MTRDVSKMLLYSFFIFMGLGSGNLIDFSQWAGAEKKHCTHTQGNPNLRSVILCEHSQFKRA